MKAVCVWVIFSIIACIIACLTGVNAKPSGSSGGTNSLDKYKAYCDAACGLGSDFCPPTCPQAALHFPAFKRGPFSDDLGSLSFDDYVFLKTLGRTKKDDA